MKEESMIERYLERGDLFIPRDNGVKAVCVVTGEGNGIYKLKNIAVRPEAQRQGYGGKLMEHIIQHYAGKCSWARKRRPVYSAFTDDINLYIRTERYDLFKTHNSMIRINPERTASLTETLTALWKASVQASHYFLTAEDIQRLVPFAKIGIRNVSTLLVSYSGEKPVGFLGIDSGKIEMLFVAPGSFRKGIGKKLVTLAIEQYDVKYVDVNEQNPQAAGFYARMGFSVFERCKWDEQGNPFPILKMKR